MTARREKPSGRENIMEMMHNHSDSFPVSGQVHTEPSIVFLPEQDRTDRHVEDIRERLLEMHLDHEDPAEGPEKDGATAAVHLSLPGKQMVMLKKT